MSFAQFRFNQVERQAMADNMLWFNWKTNF